MTVAASRKNPAYQDARTGNPATQSGAGERKWSQRLDMARDLIGSPDMHIFTRAWPPGSRKRKRWRSAWQGLT